MSSKKSKVSISNVAKLASLSLTSEEKLLYESQLKDILEYVEQIEGVETNKINATFNVTSNKNVTRPDIVGKSFTQNEALENGSEKDSFFVAKGVFENE